MYVHVHDHSTEQKHLVVLDNIKWLNNSYSYLKYNLRFKIISATLRIVKSFFPDWVTDIKGSDN